MKKVIMFGELKDIISQLVVLELNENFEPNLTNQSFYEKYISEDIQSNICINKGNCQFRLDNKDVISLSISNLYTFYDLKNKYKNILSYSVDKGYKNIVVSLLYFCSYGHKYSESLKAFNEAFDEINNSANSNLIVNVVFDIENSQLVEYLSEKYCCNNNGHSSLNIGISYKNKDNLNFLVLKENKLVDIINFFNQFEITEAYNSNNIYYNPIDFLYDYIKSNGYKLNKLHDCLSRNECSKIRTGKTNLKKYKILQIAYIFRLNKSVFIQLLVLSGYCLNPTDPLDLLFYDYYNENSEFDENDKTFLKFLDDIYYK